MASNNEQQIRELLEKYFEGVSTLAEENSLKAYFRSAEDIPSDLLYAKPMFGWFEQAAGQMAGKNVPMTENDERAIAPKRPLRPKPAIKNSAKWWISIAAAVVAVLVSCFVYYLPSNNEALCYVDGKPVNDYAVVMEQSEAAFKLLGRQVQKSTQYLSSLDQMDQSIVKSLSYLSTIMQ